MLIIILLDIAQRQSIHVTKMHASLNSAPLIILAKAGFVHHFPLGTMFILKSSPLVTGNRKPALEISTGTRTTRSLRRWAAPPLTVIKSSNGLAILSRSSSLSQSVPLPPILNF